MMNTKMNFWLKLMVFFGKYWGCHQMPRRSFFFRQYQFPVCARCTGIILGDIVSIVGVMIGITISITDALLMIIPMALDGGIQIKFNYESNNLKRLLTGIMAGIGTVMIVYNVLMIYFPMFIQLVGRELKDVLS